MRRLVYSPKAYVFIRSMNQGGKIYNISEDVVSGSLELNVNSESHASIVVRNRFRKYLADPSNGRSIFLPMDMITIWLQRLAGKPIQQLTGYLDSATMMQLYPDNMQINATCTLKKLSYSWFNPGLEFFTQWVDHLKGWYIDPTTGAAQNLQQSFALASDNPNKVTDGGFAQLISEFMTHIAGWKKSMIYVSDLPADLPELAANLYQKINKQDESALDGLSTVMRNIMGISWRADGGVMPDGTLSSQEQNITQAIAEVVNKQNIPMVVPVVAGLLATGYVPHTKIDISSPSGTDANGQPVWGYGLYSMRPKVLGGGARNHVPTAKTIQGYPIEKILQVGIATKAFVKALRAADPKGTYLQASRDGNASLIKTWIEKALGRTFDPSDYATQLAIAKKYVTSFTNNTPGQPKQPLPGTYRSLIHFNWQSPEVTGAFSGNDAKTWAKWYTHTYATLAAYYWIAKTQYKGLLLAQPHDQPPRDTLVIVPENPSSNGQALVDFFNHVKTHPGIREIDYVASKTVDQSEKGHHGKSEQVKTYYNGKSAGTPADISDLPYNIDQAVIIRIDSNAPYPTWDGQKAVPVKPTKAAQPAGAGSGAPDSPITFEDIGKMSLASAFTAQFAFPVNYIEAHFLTGYKSLMDVTSCMDGLAQFCQASMRNFKSLPNGAILAFYPDYFGAHGRTPYWSIRDIEIINAGVQMNDAQLATHVYTVGDIFGMGDGIDQWDYIASRGVVTMDMPMLLQSFIQPLNGDVKNVIKTKGNEALGTLATAFEFMKHYGARPHLEEMPMIRNSFFEFLFAWQRFMQLWASTFATEVQFTFQPEVMPGGLIAFPDHNLQMYVEQVTHTWDYTNGFYTNAQLSSPAALNPTGDGIGSLPGFALAGGVNTVGAAG